MIRGLVQNIDGLIQPLVDWSKFDISMTMFYNDYLIINHVAIALLTGFTFLQLDDSHTSLQERIFVIFQPVVLPAIIAAQVEPKHDLSRLIFYRESAAKAYKQFSFARSIVLAEMPYSFLCAVGFFFPLYYIPGFQSASSRAGYQFLIILITDLFSVTFGQMISACTPSSFTAGLLNPFLMITFALFCGVTIPQPQIPKFWRAWLYQVNPFTMLVEGMISQLRSFRLTMTDQSTGGDGNPRPPSDLPPVSTQHLQSSFWSNLRPVHGCFLLE